MHSKMSPKQANSVELGWHARCANNNEVTLALMTGIAHAKAI